MNTTHAPILNVNLKTITLDSLTRVGDLQRHDYCCEISDLGPDFRFLPLHPEPASEHGFRVRNASTMNVVTFAIYDTEIDNEGAATAWIAVPTGESMRHHPALQTMTIKLFND